MMKCQFHWLRKPEHPEETTDLRQVTDKLLQFIDQQEVLGCYCQHLYPSEDPTGSSHVTSGRGE